MATPDPTEPANHLHHHGPPRGWGLGAVMRADGSNVLITVAAA